MSKKQRGSRLVTFLIIAIFIGAGAFYIFTAHPDIVTLAKSYFKRDNSLEAASYEIYDNVVYPAESGGALWDFDYLSEGSGDAVMPLENAVITSRFGARTDPLTGKTSATHHGIDLAAGAGSRILCYKDGTVTGVEQDDPVYGKCVRVTHDGFESFYAHLSCLSVTVGDKLRGGDTIGIIGSTGRSTGVHLHFELTVDGNRVDPYQYLYEKI